MHHQGRTVSYLSYPEFDTDPHPRLAASYVVDLTALEASHTTYESRANRPLLHRKHEFLSTDDPASGLYRRLTDAEVKAGSYENPSLIGMETDGSVSWSDADGHCAATDWFGEQRARPAGARSPCKDFVLPNHDTYGHQHIKQR